MRSTLPVGLLLVGLGTIAVVGLSLAGLARTVHAQGTETWEYAYLIEVERVEIYETALERSWSASREDKAYMRAHIFLYERGFSPYDTTLNELKRLNELGAEGWELWDEVSILARQGSSLGSSSLLKRRTEAMQP